MKNVSEKFKILSKKVKQQDLRLSINNGELTVQEVQLMPVNIFNAMPINRLKKKKQVIAKELIYSFEGQVFKTIMQQIEITVKNASEIKGKNVNFEYGILVDNKFEYVNMGEYYIKDVEDDKRKEELVVTGYDKMLNFMKPFKQSDLQLTYPCTMSQLASRMSEICGVEIYSTDFYNASLVVEEDFFTVQQLTYRDVLEKIAQTTLTTIFIKENKLYLCKIGDSVQILDSSYLSNLVIGEKFGPVNALVLGRGSIEDNIEAVDQNSINTNGRCEIRFDENELIDNKREQVVDSMLEQIKGLEYYTCKASNLGLMWLDPCDVIIAKDRENSEYKTIYLSARVTINTGIFGEMDIKIPETTTTEYKVTSKEEKKTLRVERLAKKNEGLIKDIVEENTETSNKLTQHEQTMDSITSKVSSVETKAENAQDTADGINENLETNYLTTEETNALIQLLANTINLELQKKVNGETITGAFLLLTINEDTSNAKLNADKIELTAQDVLNILAGNEINFESKNITFKSTYFTLDKNGNVTAKSGKIGGFNMSDTKFIANIKYPYTFTQADRTKMINYIGGNGTLTAAEKEKYDLNNDGQITSADVVLMTKILNGTYPTSGTFELDTTSMYRNLLFKDSNGNPISSIGFNGMNIPLIHAKNIYAEESMGSPLFYLDIENIGNVEIIANGSDRVFIGSGSEYDGITTNIRGNNVRIYAHDGGGVYLGYSGSTAVTSDENLKDIYELDDKYIEFFKNLKPITYIYKDTGHRNHIGFGARQVEKALEQAGLTTEQFAGVLKDKNVTISAEEAGTKEDVHYDELYSLRYEEFIALNTAMIQNLMKQNEELKTRLETLERGGKKCQ